MAKSYLVLRAKLPRFESVNNFYRCAPHEPTTGGGLLSVGSVATFGTNFEDLLDAIIKHKQPYLIVVAHANPTTGLSLKMGGPKTHVVSSGFRYLKFMVDSIRREGDAPDPDWVREYLSYSNLTETEAIRVAKKCWTIRRTDGLALELHFRGCELGLNSYFLEDFQSLFRSKVVSAPKCPMLYTPVTPNWGTWLKDVEAWGVKRPVVGRRYTYKDKEGVRGPMLMDLFYDPVGETSSGQGAVQNVADIKKWAQVFHRNANSPSDRSFPICALYPNSDDDYYLPHEHWYHELIRTVTKPPQ